VSEKAVDMSGETAIALRFDDVSFSYGGIPVISGASFHLHSGEFAALVGPNGAGKTTLLRLALALARPSSGRIEVLGMAPEAARDSIGYVPQHASYDPAFPISVSEVVRMGLLDGMSPGRAARRKAAAAEALEAADLSDLGDRPYSALSGGQRRRVLVARALASKPRLLILDEPTANMDSDSEARLYRALGDIKGRATVLVVTHDSGFVSDLTDVVLCVGDPPGGPAGGRSVVRHAARAESAPPGLFGGRALRVLHDTDLPEGACCGENCVHRRKGGAL
jgi:zinc transport system ATP-binding protein